MFPRSHTQATPTSLRKRGFTLIELLTVIAIIGILAAIIIPVVGKVREKAKNMQCLSNMRAWGQAINLFASDNKGYIYLSLGVDSGGSNHELDQNLYEPYLSSHGSNYSGRAQIYFLKCPAVRSEIDESLVKRQYTFIIPRDAEQKILADGNKPSVINLSKVVNPSKLLVMSEKKSDSSEEYIDIKRKGIVDIATNVNPIVDRNNAAYEKRHGDKASILYIDGHVDSKDKNFFNPPPQERQAFIANYLTIAGKY